MISLEKFENILIVKGDVEIWTAYLNFTDLPLINGWGFSNDERLRQELSLLVEIFFIILLDFANSVDFNLSTLNLLFAEIKIIDRFFCLRISFFNF